MLHISGNYYLDVCPDCFILQEKTIVPEINRKTNSPNKKPGEILWVNQSFHPTHKDVIAKLVTIGLRNSVEGKTKECFDFLNEVEAKFDEIIKVKR